MKNHLKNVSKKIVFIYNLSIGGFGNYYRLAQKISWKNKEKKCFINGLRKIELLEKKTEKN